jgi:hypothetical protein
VLGAVVGSGNTRALITELLSHWISGICDSSCILSLVHNFHSADSLKLGEHWRPSWYIEWLRAGRLEDLVFWQEKASRPALGPTQPPTQCVTGAVSMGMKWQEREADYSLPYTAEVKNGEAIPPPPHSSS